MYSAAVFVISEVTQVGEFLGEANVGMVTVT
jgi:hypothetical protein